MIEQTEQASCAMFERALRGIHKGIILADKATGGVIYMNEYAQMLLEKADDVVKVDEIVRRAVNPTQSLDLGSVETNSTMNELVRAGSTSIGLTVHVTDDSLAVVTLREVGGNITLVDEIEEEEDGSPVMTVLAQLCHEIGNPLNSMKLTLQVLMQNLDTFSTAKTHSYLVRTVKEVARLEVLLTQFKQLTAQRRLESREVDLRVAVFSFVQNVKETCEASGVDVKVDLPSDACFVRAEPDSLQQIFHNLFRNSVDAKDLEQERLQFEFSSVATADNMVRLIVRDDGIGIPPHRLPLVFRPMFTTKTHGTGVGLALVARLMKRMGGGVRIASGEGRGTRIELLLPAGAPV